MLFLHFGSNFEFQLGSFQQEEPGKQNEMKRQRKLLVKTLIFDVHYWLLLLFCCSLLLLLWPTGYKLQIERASGQTYRNEMAKYTSE